jgi:thiosulfate/3-mercaptopyruvate sulfurtransferase
LSLPAFRESGTRSCDERVARRGRLAARGRILLAGEHRLAREESEGSIRDGARRRSQRLRSTGHLAGARRLEWQAAFTDTNDFTPRSIAELSALWAERVTPGDTVVAYCYIGYRASGSYFISRLLGYPAKLYDGSYEEWAGLKYPTVTAPTPLRKP